MKIAVSVEQDLGQDSPVAHHFGRCPFFALVTAEDDKITAVEVVQNPFYAAHQPGQVPGYIQQQGANVMLSGGMGRRALEFFREFDIEVATGAAGTAGQAAAAYLAGELSGAAGCAHSEDHHHHRHQD